MAGTPPRRAEAFTFAVGLVSQADANIFVAGPTIAAGDVLVSRDQGATFNNIAVVPSAAAGNNRVIVVALSALEMTPTVGDQIWVLFHDVAGAQWQDKLVIIPTVTNTLDDVTTVSFPMGVINFTYTVRNSVTGLPVADVDIRISTDIAGTNVIWAGTTDAFGVARDVNGALPSLNAGTYYFWKSKIGFIDPDDPNTEVVS